MAFVAYLRLKGRRSHQAAAVQTGRPLGAIRRLSAQFNWPGRVAAFEARLADATQNALENGIRATANTSQANCERHRLGEFQLAHEVLQQSRLWLKRATDCRRRQPSLGQVARIIQLACKLGRLSAGMPTGDEPRRRPRPEDRPDYWTGHSVEEALEKIYGREAPATSVPGGSVDPANRESKVARASPPCARGNLDHEMSNPEPAMHRRRDAWKTWARHKSAAMPA